MGSTEILTTRITSHHSSPTDTPDYQFRLDSQTVGTENIKSLVKMLNPSNTVSSKAAAAYQYQKRALKLQMRWRDQYF